MEMSRYRRESQRHMAGSGAEERILGIFWCLSESP